ncbi:MBL fold metallo-hydrolase [Solirubrobacter soli]|uniref:MBL fold metallo-hydrolase n=1 Tax=Solirubrobacter soli TaxID=363832 RepID=UPI00040CDFBF|nr:MBL fold metallo-hydrolase [Solirubrobacter soli]
MASLLVHRYRSEVANTPVNAYLIEGSDGIVGVDATLTVTGGLGVRALADALGKPLLGVVLTHAHPDHYGGLVELVAGRDVPVFATERVHEVIRRDDPVKEQILRPMIGDEWPAERAFPTDVVKDGETIELGDIALTVTDLGPSESPADSIWTLTREPQRVFSADIAYDRTHCYLADGFYEPWLASIRRLREELAPATTLHPGHGDPSGLEVLDWQERYIETMLGAVRDADWHDPQAARASVIATMRTWLPSDQLAFLMELSVQPLAGRLGVAA